MFFIVNIVLLKIKDIVYFISRTLRDSGKTGKTCHGAVKREDAQIRLVSSTFSCSMSDDVGGR